jgi:hypothetical protein
MRNLLLASLASLTVTAALQNDADACGPYGGVYAPRVFQLTTHSINNRDNHSWTTRSFALLAQAPEGSPAWRQIAPFTYDYTQIADAPDLDDAMELTLVGPSGTKVVSSRSRVFLKPALGWDHTPTSALELTVKRGEFSIALAGRHTDTKWIAIEGERSGTEADVAWIKQVIAADFDSKYVYVSKVKGTGLETLSAMGADGKYQTFVRRGEQFVDQFAGSARGAITFKGKQFIVQADAGAMRARRVY